LKVALHESTAVRYVATAVWGMDSKCLKVVMSSIYPAVTCSLTIQIESVEPFDKEASCLGILQAASVSCRTCNLNMPWGNGKQVPRKRPPGTPIMQVRFDPSACSRSLVASSWLTSGEHAHVIGLGPSNLHTILWLRQLPQGRGLIDSCVHAE
jgi:hypothetical protein